MATIRGDGSISSSAGYTGVWKLTSGESADRKYTIVWDDVNVIDRIGLSKDGRALSGVNQTGMEFSALRLKD